MMFVDPSGMGPILDFIKSIPGRIHGVLQCFFGQGIISAGMGAASRLVTGVIDIGMNIVSGLFSSLINAGMGLVTGLLTGLINVGIDLFYAGACAVVSMIAALTPQVRRVPRTSVEFPTTQAITDGILNPLNMLVLTFQKTILPIAMRFILEVLLPFSSLWGGINNKVIIPQDGNIGTFITYMGYHKITTQGTPEYNLKTAAENSNRYSIKSPEYYATIDGRIAIATKANIGGQLRVAIGDYVNVEFETNSGVTTIYQCIIGDEKDDGAQDNIWGHDGGKSVVEVIYHDYSPSTGYNANINNPWGAGRVISITKVGSYGSF